MFDFRGLRLDWARLQSYLSSGKGSVLEKQRELAALLNTVRWETMGIGGPYRTGRIYSSPPARDQSWRNSASLPHYSTLSGGKQWE